tara:strand:- start:390 stop:881 length:492 start_codon:yes stop_codon:yes gene_type:complete
METLLINIQDVRKLTNLSKNVTTQKYKQYIISAQNIQLRDILGVDCLSDLQAAKCSNTLDQYQAALLDIIKPYLINYSYAKYVYSSPLVSTEEGIVKLSGDNILHLTDQEKKREQYFYESNAESYHKQIIELLESDPVNYPCYHNSGKCGCCNSSSNGKSIFD